MGGDTSYSRHHSEVHSWCTADDTKIKCSKMEASSFQRWCACVLVPAALESDGSLVALSDIAGLSAEGLQRGHASSKMWLPPACAARQTICAQISLSSAEEHFDFWGTKQPV